MVSEKLETFLERQRRKVLPFLEKTSEDLGVIVSSCCPFNGQHEDTKKVGTKALIAALDK